MRGIEPTSQAFQADQLPIALLQYWDTAMTAVDPSSVTTPLAAHGMRLDVREPLVDGTWDLPTVLRTQGTVGDAQWASAGSKPVITNGRWPNAIAYWAGGSPSQWGSSVYRKVAVRMKGVFRAPTQRDWFATGSPVAVQFGVGGSGYVRIQLNGTTVFGGPTLDAAGGDTRGVVTEQRYITQGLAWTGSINVATGDTLEILYAQTGDEPWGGFVVKVLNPANTVYGIVSQTSKRKHRREAGLVSAVAGCGLFTQAEVSPATISMIGDLDVDIAPGQTPKLEFHVPLVNDAMEDGVGWKWVVTGTDKSGYLIATDIDGNAVTLRRNRLVRCRLGFKDFVGAGSETWSVITGYIDDFEPPSNGVVTVRVLGFENRLAEQLVKNYPDPISYMTYDYHKLKGTTEPIYAIAAYDNWPIELALRDLLLRAGVDESRMGAALLVPQADGTMTDVEI